LFKATEHRVKTSSKKTRFSIPFFYNPNYDTVVEPFVCENNNNIKNSINNNIENNDNNNNIENNDNNNIENNINNNIENNINNNNNIENNDINNENSSNNKNMFKTKLYKKIRWGDFRAQRFIFIINIIII
jgi:hypothetical protein